MPTLKGKALYLELVPDKDNLTEREVGRVCSWLGSEAVKQIIIFPPSVDDTGREQRGIMLSRTISPRSPRGQWEWTNTTTQRVKSIELDDDTKTRTSYANVTTYTKEEWDLLPEASKVESHKLALDHAIRGHLYFTDYEYDEEGEYVRDSGGDLVRNTKQGWVIRGGKPIAVETTDEDYSDLHDKSKTPQAVIRRINKVRESLADFPTKLV